MTIGGDKARDEAFASAQADALEAEIAWTQLSPVARRVLDAEVRRLRDIAAQQRARNSLVRDLGRRDEPPGREAYDQQSASRVVSLTPKPMPAVEPCDHFGVGLGQTDLTGSVTACSRCGAILSDAWRKPEPSEPSKEGAE